MSPPVSSNHPIDLLVLRSPALLSHVVITNSSYCVYFGITVPHKPRSQMCPSS